MAEKNKNGNAQNSQGQLFIDIGARGLGSLLKGLQGLQAKFLLAKKSGEEFIKPFKAMSENASNAVVNYDKLHSVMGTAIEDLQDYAKFAKLNNIAPGQFLNQVKTAQQQLFKIRAGLDSTGQQGLALLGLNPWDFDYNKPMDFIMTVKKKLDTVNPALRAQVLQMMGWSEEMAYMFDRYDYYLDKQKVKFNDRFLLNKKEMQNLREQNDAWNVLRVTIESIQEKFISRQTWINKLLEKTLNWVNGTHPILSKMMKEFEQFANNPHPILENLFNSMGWAGEKLLQILKNTGEWIGEQKVYSSYDVIDQKSKAELRFNRNPEVRNRYEEIQRIQKEGFEKERQKYEMRKNAKNPDTNQQTETIANAKNLSIDNNIVPPLPNVAPSGDFALPRSEQNNNYKNVEFTVINNINQDINGGNAVEIGQRTADNIKEMTFESFYNQNQARI